jgi:LPPG:FO 2-phospho-L-lactate transferase
VRVVVLAGGFGGARMAHGFALLGADVEVTVIVNTGDDLELHGLYISPDLDTVMYTLAGLANAETGWGVADETWSASAMLARYGRPTWFGLGDRDLATHIVRTQALRQGEPLSAVTARLAAALGVGARLLPMSDDRVSTKVRTDDGWLDFQDYFVRRHFADAVRDVRFDGADAARAGPGTLEAIVGAELIVVAPSNPFVSVGPILAVPGLLDGLCSAAAPVVAISPIVGGSALRGPAAAMLRSLAGERGSAGLARHYAARYPGLIDVLVIDGADAGEGEAIAATGIAPRVERTVLADEADRRALAERVLPRTMAG